jgi:hypothetical protein
MTLVNVQIYLKVRVRMKMKRVVEKVMKVKPLVMSMMEQLDGVVYEQGGVEPPPVYEQGDEEPPQVYEQGDEEPPPVYEQGDVEQEDEELHLVRELEDEEGGEEVLVGEDVELLPCQEEDVELEIHLAE